jgi:hypothetical protein
MAREAFGAANLYHDVNGLTAAVPAGAAGAAQGGMAGGFLDSAPVGWRGP